MTGYNKVNGAYAGGSAHLIRDVLKGAWAYPGWVMSDWGATPSWEFALAGLDQESGVQMDVVLWGKEAFADLRAALADGRLPRERLSDMVCRILRSIRAVGVDDGRPAPEVDMVAHDTIALEGARQGIVLLENDGILPVPGDTTMRILVLGMHANVGVPAGTGSSAVTPPGGFAATIRVGGPGVMGPSRNLYLLPSVPLEEIRRAFPQATVDFSPGLDPAESALAARNADLVIAFGLRPEGESFDLASLDLPWGQDAVIDAVADANPNTVVVLMTGNPSTMGWRHKVRAVLQAWYPGQSGARAIAEVISGQVNPSGRLPMTFPTDPAQTPRPELPGLGTPWGTPTAIDYDEGSDVGYRWYARTSATPMYAFGHGLSYTTFEHTDLSLAGGQTVTGTVTVTNTGDRTGADVVQVYLTGAAGERLLRLIAFERVVLEPGESRQVAFDADPRLLARFDGAAGQWRITGGPYEIAIGRSATDLVRRGQTELAPRLFGA
jgi:beta-glucosidase